jgi:hypothetical protein
MILRRVFGETGFDYRGFWIRDEHAGLDVRVGNITPELAREFKQHKVKSKDWPVFGVMVSKKF